MALKLSNDCKTFPLIKQAGPPEMQLEVRDSFPGSAAASLSLNYRSNKLDKPVMCPRPFSSPFQIQCVGRVIYKRNNNNCLIPLTPRGGPWRHYSRPIASQVLTSTLRPVSCKINPYKRLPYKTKIGMYKSYIHNQVVFAREESCRTNKRLSN